MTGGWAPIDLSNQSDEDLAVHRAVVTFDDHEDVEVVCECEIGEDHEEDGGSWSEPF